MYFTQNFYKATNNADILVNPASIGQQVLAVTFLISVDALLCPTPIFWLSHSLDSYVKPTGLFFSALSTGLCLLSDLPSLLHFQSRGRYRPQSFV